MRVIIGIFFLAICQLAQATTIFYIPQYFAEGGEEIAVIYLTDEHSEICQPPRMVARTEILLAPEAKSSLVCWSLINEEIWGFLANGKQYHIDDTKAGLVPGAEKEAYMFLNKMIVQDKSKVFKRSLKNANKPR